MRGERIDPTTTEDYYNYYHSLKPHDPRLPLPKWKPVFHGKYQLLDFYLLGIATPFLQQNIPNHQMQNDSSNIGGFRKASLPEKFGEMNNFASHFDQAMNLNLNKPSSPQL